MVSHMKRRVSILVTQRLDPRQEKLSNFNMQDPMSRYPQSIWNNGVERLAPFPL